MSLPLILSLEMVNSLLDTIMFTLTQQSPRKTSATRTQKNICGSRRTDVTDGAGPVEEQTDGPRQARDLQREPEGEEGRALEETVPFYKSYVFGLMW